MNKTYHIETYGCQMNEYDSELIESMLRKSNYTKSKSIYDAGVIFLNTCAIREKAEETVCNKLDGLAYLKERDPSTIIGVVGCMAQNLKQDILDSRPYVDVVLGPDSYRRIPEIISSRNSDGEHFVDTRLSKFEVYEDLFPSRKEGVNAWISIMRGCDKFCTFCIVPFTRGRERSRSISSIIDETKDAVKNGFCEITLLGQNVNSFTTPAGGFSELLDNVAMVEGVKRIRYTSPHPQDMNEDLLNVMKKHNNICNYIHLPLQSGSDNILKRMNRTYTRDEFLQLVDKIKYILPNCSLSTDIIVGFPGETEDDFQSTLSLMDKVSFNSAFMFKYSSRPGTKAAEYDEQIDESIKQDRLERLIAFQKIHTLKNNQNYLGKRIKVLIEKESKKSSNQWSGRSDGNTWVIFDKNDEKIKDIVEVEIYDAQGVTLFGNKVKEGVYEAA